MRRSVVTVGFALGLVACGDAATVDDAGAARDAGRDAAGVGGAGSGGSGGSGGTGGVDAAVAPDPSCGARVVDYSYQRPYGDTAPWNVPVCDLLPWQHSDEYVRRFWFFSENRNADPTVDDPMRANHRVDFGLDAPTDYAPPVYSATDATTTRRVRIRTGWGGTNIDANEQIPWNPAWRAMRGGDAVAIILDPATGREINLWGVVQTDGAGIYNDSQCWLTPGYNSATDLCVGSAHVVRDPAGQVADYRTYTGNHPSRGVGVQFYAMVVTPQEVQAGEIRHALMMGANNTMFGPSCTDAQLDTAEAGVSCGFSVAPAGGIEWETVCGVCGATNLSDQELRERSIPEGIRFALRMSDDEIDAWLQTRGYTGPLRETARIFAVALRDYGWFITDTGGTAPWSVSGAANVETEQAWRDLGIAGDGKQLLFGLLARERLWVVEPPTNDCHNGAPSQFGCRTANAHY